MYDSDMLFLAIKRLNAVAEKMQRKEYDSALDELMNEATEFFEWAAFSIGRRSGEIEVPDSEDDVDPYERAAIIAETATGADGRPADGATIATMIRAWGAAAAKRAKREAEVDPIAVSNARQSAFFEAADRDGTNDRADVTSGDGYSRFDGGDDGGEQ